MAKAGRHVRVAPPWLFTVFTRVSRRASPDAPGVISLRTCTNRDRNRLTASGPPECRIRRFLPVFFKMGDLQNSLLIQTVNGLFDPNLQ